WLPAEHEYRGMHHADVSRAHAAGLRCRPLTETVADTWAWLLSVGKAPARRSDLPAPGLDPARERAALAAWHACACGRARPARRQPVRRCRASGRPCRGTSRRR
ncbi:MAG: hypothetical protein QOF26_528, partial [Baekduia sp.]|nr:hypothetical protein [Baekduia sp.]